MQELVTITDQKAVTTTLVIANAFEKQHKDVLRAISRLECSEEFTERNFAPSSYLDPSGRALPMFQITRDGFTFLAMGFTGKKAAEFKERFIAAFNAMEQALLEGQGDIRRVEFNHMRGITNPHGLDIKYTLDLTQALKPLPAGERLAVIHRLTGVDLSDIIDRLPVTGGASATVARFVKEHVREAPGERVETRRVYAVYSAFCAQRGEKPLAATSFGRDLRRLCPGIVDARGPAEGGSRPNCYGNLTLIDSPLN